MTRSRAHQLPLPCTFEEATSLLDDITALQHTVAWQQSKMTALQEQRDALQADRETWRELHRQTQATLTAAYAEIARLQTNLRVAHTLMFKTAATLPDWMDRALVKLIALVHPDKWQEQPADRLAHEATAGLLAMRQRLREGQG